MMLCLQLTASNGPQECCLAVRKALAVLLRDCAAAGVAVDTLAQVPSDVPGNLRSVLLALDGAQAQAVAQRWCGTLLWICPSPYRPRHRRKNWFIGAEGFEVDAPSMGAESLQERDIYYEAVRASGPGGQHVNTTDSAVRATHRPSGLSVKVQTERSQHANKRLARALLAHHLATQADTEQRAARDRLWRQHHGLARGNPARTFRGPDFEEV